MAEDTSSGKFNIIAVDVDTGRQEGVAYSGFDIADVQAQQKLMQQGISSTKFIIQPASDYRENRQFNPAPIVSTTRTPQEQAQLEQLYQQQVAQSNIARQVTGGSTAISSQDLSQAISKLTPQQMANVELNLSPSEQAQFNKLQLQEQTSSSSTPFGSTTLNPNPNVPSAIASPLSSQPNSISEYLVQYGASPSQLSILTQQPNQNIPFQQRFEESSFGKFTEKIEKTLTPYAEFIGSPPIYSFSKTTDIHGNIISETKQPANLKAQLFNQYLTPSKNENYFISNAKEIGRESLTNIPETLAFSYVGLEATKAFPVVSTTLFGTTSGLSIATSENPLKQSIKTGEEAALFIVGSKFIGEGQQSPYDIAIGKSTSAKFAPVTNIVKGVTQDIGQDISTITGKAGNFLGNIIPENKDPFAQLRTFNEQEAPVKVTPLARIEELKQESIGSKGKIKVSQEQQLIPAQSYVVPRKNAPVSESSFSIAYSTGATQAQSPPIENKIGVINVQTKGKAQLDILQQGKSLFEINAKEPSTSPEISLGITTKEGLQGQGLTQQGRQSKSIFERAATEQEQASFQKGDIIRLQRTTGIPIKEEKPPEIIKQSKPSVPKTTMIKTYLGDFTIKAGTGKVIRGTPFVEARNGDVPLSDIQINAEENAKFTGLRNFEKLAESSSSSVSVLKQAKPKGQSSGKITNLPPNYQEYQPTISIEEIPRGPSLFKGKLPKTFSEIKINPISSSGLNSRAEGIPTSPRQPSALQPTFPISTNIFLSQISSIQSPISKPSITQIPSVFNPPKQNQSSISFQNPIQQPESIITIIPKQNIVQFQKITQNEQSIIRQNAKQNLLKVPDNFVPNDFTKLFRSGGDSLGGGGIGSLGGKGYKLKGRKYKGTPSLSVVTLGKSAFGIKLTKKQLKGKEAISPYQIRKV